MYIGVWAFSINVWSNFILTDHTKHYEITHILWLLWLQLTLVLKEVEDLKQQAISSQEKWEYEKLRLKEDM